MIGRLQYRVGLYRPADVADDIGGTVRSWQFDRALWAAIRSEGFSEEETGGRRFMIHRFRVVVRHRADIAAPSRLLWRGRTLKIVAVSDPDMRGERLHLICEETVQ